MSAPIVRSPSLSQVIWIHTGEKSYGCLQCDKAFSTAGELKLHTRTHTGEKPYVCSHCHKSFPQSSHLKTHMKTHSAENDYKCLQCDKVFSTANSLKLHSQTHTGEKPYVCTHCQKYFSQLGNLKKHKNVHSWVAENNIDKLVTISIFVHLPRSLLLLLLDEMVKVLPLAFTAVI